MTRSLILGIGGQGGSYLAEILLERGDEVHGLVRRSSADNLFRVRHLLGRVTLHPGDLTDRGSIMAAWSKCRAQQVWNMADQDHVGFSHAAPRLSIDVTYGGVASLLETVGSLKVGGKPLVRVFQPLSVTVFGDAPAPQHEGTPLAPQSPYACAKAAAWLLCKHHRREHGADVRCAVFANHDSPRRQGDYLLHKIVRQALAEGRVEVPDVAFDLSFAGDLMHDAVSIMSLPEPDDFVLGSGTGAVKASALAAFALAAAGHDPLDVQVRADDRVGPVYAADCSKARSRFELHPRKPLRELVGEIVDKYRKEQP